MRFTERNDQESEGQWVAQDLDGPKPHIRDRIGVQVLRNLNEAKNMTTMVELMMQEKGEGKFHTNRRNYEADQYQKNLLTRIKKYWQNYTKLRDIKGLKPKRVKNKRIHMED